MKKLNIILLIFTPLFTFAQTTLIADPTFEQRLINLGLDTGTPDGSVPTANINTITSLDVSNDTIKDLSGIEDFTALAILNCSMNWIDTLDISHNTDLSYLSCEANGLDTLDVSQNINLEYLNCNYQKSSSCIFVFPTNPNDGFFSLDLSQNTNLKHLSCNSVGLNNLDVSQNSELEFLDCGLNGLFTLNLNGADSLKFLYCNGFNNDGTFCPPMSNVTSLDVSHNKALISLHCSYNYFTNGSLELTQNTLLDTLECINNWLSTLKLNSQASLSTINCSDNQISNLDLIGYTALTTLVCSQNSLTNLDLTGATALINLNFSENGITSIDISSAINLTDINSQQNWLTSIDVSNNTALISLDCYHNQLTSIDLSNNTALTFLNCGYNQLYMLDLSKNTNLETIYLWHNDLSCLNLKNGNNINIIYFYSMDNPNLNCIDVDDVSWATANFLSIDQQTSFSTDCNNACSVGIQESTFNHNLYPNPASDQVMIELENFPTTLTLLDVQGKTVFQDQIKERSYRLDVSTLDKGIYIIRTGNFGSKLIVE